MSWTPLQVQSEMTKKYLLSVLSMLSFFTLAEQPPVGPVGLVQATFVGEQVSLVNADGQCMFTRAGATPLLMDMAWPCRFSVTRHQSLRVETFDQTPILMVERSEHLPAPDLGCRTVVQAVRWYKGKLETARAQHIAMCGPGNWDQKMFMAVFDW
jgi:hypothetical protein